MKVNFNFWHILLFVVICGGLVYLTHSFLMSLGILLLLFVGDNFAQEIDRRRAIKERDRQREEQQGSQE